MVQRKPYIADKNLVFFGSLFPRAQGIVEHMANVLEHGG